MLPRGGRVLVALSGGPDSVALLHILRTLERRGALVVAGAAHFNHQLRGADADARRGVLPRSRGGRRACRFVAGRTDVARARERNGTLGRGCGAAGPIPLSERCRGRARRRRDRGRALPRRSGRDVPAAPDPRRRRRRARRHPATDESRDPAASRDLPRRAPALRRRARARISRGRLERRSARSRGTGSGTSSCRTWSSFRRPSPRRWPATPVWRARTRNFWTGLQSNPPIRSSYLRVTGSRLTSRDSRRWLRLSPLASPGRRFRRLRPTGSSAFSTSTICWTWRAAAPRALPSRCRASRRSRRGHRIVFGMVTGAPFSNSFRFPLSIPGEVGGARVGALGRPGWTTRARSRPPAARGDTAVVAAAPLQGPLAVRTRRRGDTFKPLGMGGRGRKLQDFLVDRKIARADRDSLPLVVDGDDRIVWVVGQSVAEDFRVTAPKQGVILLKARRLGGVG